MNFDKYLTSDPVGWFNLFQKMRGAIKKKLNSSNRDHEKRRGERGEHGQYLNRDSEHSKYE